MTMFSIKPKFDLAEFLAVPARPGATRFRNAGRRGMQFRSGATSKDATEPTVAEDLNSTDRSKS
jgi:hypothetical protein